MKVRLKTGCGTMGFELEIMEGRTVYGCVRERQRERDKDLPRSNL